jgi:regulator of protease activity HflC (stomatin/prohibitin superfamily)
MFFIYTVEQQTYAVVERWGKFNRITGPGIHLKIPIAESVRGTVSIRVRELEVKVSSKSSDNVFVDLLIAVQYFVEQEDIWKAFYRLSQPREQMQSYVFDSVRAKVPTMTIDEVFERKEDVANDVRDKLSDVMEQYGYSIITALVNDVVPDTKVVNAMNEINAQQRLRVAAEHKGEADKILVIKAAEADAQSKKLSGQGIADQRRAIVDGLRESVTEFKEATGVDAKEVMTLVLMTQYYDMLAAVGDKSKANTIMIPHSPAAVGDLKNQIMEAILASRETT